MNNNPILNFALTAACAGFVLAGCAPPSGTAAPAEKDAAAAVRALGTADFDQTVAKGIALVDFWAPWCGPCRAQGPIVEKVAEQVGAKAIVAKVNVDENQATAERFGVSGIPTLIVFKDGKPVQKFVGVQNLETLVQAIGSAAEQ